LGISSIKGRFQKKRMKISAINACSVEIGRADMLCPKKVNLLNHIFVDEEKEQEKYRRYFRNVRLGD
jgi:hypothetical protein